MSVSTPILIVLAAPCARAAPLQGSAPATGAATAALRRVRRSRVMRRLPSLCSVAASDAEVLVQAAERRGEFVVVHHVHDPPVLHDVVAVGHRLGEAEV